MEGKSCQGHDGLLIYMGESIAVLLVATMHFSDLSIDQVKFASRSWTFACQH